MPHAKLNRWLGLLALLVCASILFVWIPLDVDTGIVEKVRRQVRLGDAFAPSIAAIIIGLGGLMLLLKGQVSGPYSDRSNTETDQLHPSATSNDSDGNRQFSLLSDCWHAIIVFILSAIAVLLMRYVGPLVLHWVDGGTSEYRLLRDTVPWKYLGFIAGGIFLVVSLISYTEKRLRAVHFLVAIAIVTLLVAFYDLPFEDLLLPPNGDV